VRIVFTAEEQCRLVDERSGRQGLQLQQRESNGACPVGCWRDQTVTRQWSASHQTNAQAQRHRGMGDHAEVTRVEAMST